VVANANAYTPNIMTYLMLNYHNARNTLAFCSVANVPQQMQDRGVDVVWVLDVATGNEQLERSGRFKIPARIT
jgi:hypothetical protein